MRDGDWKLCLKHDGTGAQLYHLAGDMGETNSVALQHPDVVERLSRLALDWKQTLPAKLPK